MLFVRLLFIVVVLLNLIKQVHGLLNLLVDPVDLAHLACLGLLVGALLGTDYGLTVALFFQVLPIKKGMVTF